MFCGTIHKKSLEVPKEIMEQTSKKFLNITDNSKHPMKYQVNFCPAIGNTKVNFVC